MNSGQATRRLTNVLTCGPLRPGHLRLGLTRSFIQQTAYSPLAYAALERWVNEGGCGDDPDAGPDLRSTLTPYASGPATSSGDLQ